MSTAKVSVVIANYNKQDFIEETLKSLERQKFKDFEVIICDDASTDKSVKILNSYKGPLDLHIIKSKTNSGCSLSLNKAIEFSIGKYIMLLDSDDILRPNCISESIAHLIEHPRAGVVYSNYQMIDRHGQPIPISLKRREIGLKFRITDDTDRIRRFRAIPGTGSLFRTEALRSVGFFEPHIRIQDNQIGLKMAASNWEVHKLHSYLWEYRQVPNNLCSDTASQLRDNLLAVELVRDHPEYIACVRSAVGYIASGALSVGDKKLARKALANIPISKFNRKIAGLWLRSRLPM